MTNNEQESNVKLENPSQQKMDNKVVIIDEHEIEINDKLRNTFFVLLCIEYCISCCDGGIIPQQNEKLIISFEDDGDSRVGLYGSIDYIGRILGALLMSLLINKINRKLYFSGCCILKAITLFIPIISPKYSINLIFRLLSGIPQTILTSYGTMWTDQFGKRKYRSLMLAILQFSTLLGAVVGYGIGIIWNAILGRDIKKDLTWRLSFFIEGIALGVIGIFFFFYPKLYFSSSFFLNKDNDYKGKEKLYGKFNQEILMKNPQNSFWKQLPQLVCTKLFIFMSISNTVAFFGMRVIQYYADKYMEKVLKISENIKHILYIIICITGPIVGNIIFGIICTKIGGYVSKNGMILILVLNIVASISSTFITITLNPALSLIFCWLYLFSYASSVPLQGGLIIASLPKKLKSNGFALNMFLLNFIGSFPSSYVYSLISDALDKHYPDEEGKKYRTAMTITMAYNYVGLILACVAGIFRFRIEGQLDNENEEDEKNDKDELFGIN